MEAEVVRMYGVEQRVEWKKDGGGWERSRLWNRVYIEDGFFYR